MEMMTWMVSRSDVAPRPGSQPRGLLAGVLVGGQLQRAVEDLLKVALLDRQRPVGELRSSPLPAFSLSLATIDQCPTSPASAIVRNSNPSSGSSSSARYVGGVERRLALLELERG
jgi:hypothetical protein